MKLALHRLPPVLPIVFPLEDDSNFAKMTIALALMSGKISFPHVFADATLAEAEDFYPSASSIVVTLVSVESTFLANLWLFLKYI